ncbi:MAG: divalent-cation tolerance protein CutA [Candidatus Omnitrophica bacterium]|nr:divalent-cation tolerance protein CutA [Candidatus Omnitrophota bacterium]
MVGPGRPCHCKQRRQGLPGLATKKLIKKPFLLLSTTGSLSEAQQLAKTLLQSRLAGCVNLIQGINSWYWWQGKLDHSREVLLLVKTSRDCLPKLAKLLKKHHSYQVPELIAVPIEWGDRNYLNWLEQNIQV